MRDAGSKGVSIPGSGDHHTFPDGSSVNYDILRDEWIIVEKTEVMTEHQCFIHFPTLTKQCISPTCAEGCVYKDLPTSARGTKQDSNKPRWSLLPADTIPEVIDVLEFGAARYSPGNWAHVPDARTRYYDAMMRHIEAWWRGEKADPDSGKPHLAHACCCILFLLAFDKVKTNA